MTAIIDVDWEDDTYFSSASSLGGNSSFKSCFTMMVVLQFIGIVFSFFFFFFQFITQFPAFICGIFEGRLSLLKIITASLTVVFHLAAVVYFCLNAASSIDDGMASCPDHKWPCNHLFGDYSDGSVDNTWGLDYGLYTLFVMTMFALFILIVVILFRHENPQSSEVKSGSKSFELRLFKFEWSGRAYILILVLVSCILTILSYYYPWYYTRLEDKSSDVVTIMDYYLKHVEHRKIEDSSKSQKKIWIQEIKWGDDTTDTTHPVNGELEGVFFMGMIFFIMLSINMILVFCFSCVNRFPRLSCPGCPSSIVKPHVILLISAFILSALTVAIVPLQIPGAMKTDRTGDCPEKDKDPCNTLIGSLDQNGAAYSWGLDFGWLFLLISALLLIPAMILPCTSSPYDEDDAPLMGL
eukprot:TRINITY_DN42308_c0_g1_i1.p1 TRINITY_DN42308_c0_g1~~TRINITY_DN42308_c0_g1_i1.p1  ORF type:complete len:435 (+),score=34.70 TRINITY_DN42308_c0_g1_i1:76-1305(+)